MKVYYSYIIHILQHLLYSAYSTYSYLYIVYAVKDGDQSVEFYWIDPMLSAERIAGKSKYSGHMYFQYLPEWSWERPGIRAFGRVNGGLVFETCYMIDKHSVPLLSVFYADKAHNRGWSHHPIYRKLIYHNNCPYLT